MNTRKSSRMLIGLVGAATAAALVMPGAAFAAKGGGGGGGSGGKPTSEASQNLSVPAILVGPLGTLACGTSAAAPSPLVPPPPTGTPLTGYEVPGYYWVQKVHTWQAQCFNAETASVLGSWGDNLAGDAKLSTGSPIRVEIVLTNSADFGGLTMQGYNVIKLQPTLADRLSAYGHLAVGNELDGWTAVPGDVSEASWVVHDAGMQISVQNLDTGVFAVPLQPIAPEINATGKIVYGYNLRVTAAGTYQIRFASTPAVTFTGTDVANLANDANNAYLDIEVTAKASGGGGGGRP